MRRFRLIAIDVLLIAVATVAAVLLRDNLTFIPANFEALAPYLAFSMVLALPVLALTGASSAIWRFSSFRDYVRLVIATTIIVCGAVALTFGLNRLEGIGRSLPILQALLCLVFLTGARVAMRLRHAPRAKSPSILAAMAADDALNVLVVGLGPLADAYLRSVSELGGQKLRVVGLVGRNRRHVGRNVMNHEILGTPEDLDDLLQRLEVHGVGIDRIVVATPLAQMAPEARAALSDVEKGSAIEFDYLFERLLLPDDSGSSSGGRRAEPRAPQTQTHFSVDALDVDRLARRPYWRLKRVVDIVGSAALMIALAPIALVVAIIVALDVGSPVLFWQQRPGLCGRPFRLYKFRTMRAGHDRNGRRRSDAERLSPVGKFLRRTRLDELPQLVNILFGEMSFIGPRPLLPIDQAPEYAPRLLVRPGLTGWAQVIGGRDIAADDKAALDIWYVKNASLALDIETMVRTVGMVLFGERVVERLVTKARSELRQAGVLIVRSEVSEVAEVKGETDGVRDTVRPVPVTGAGSTRRAEPAIASRPATGAAA